MTALTTRIRADALRYASSAPDDLPLEDLVQHVAEAWVGAPPHPNLIAQALQSLNGHGTAHTGDPGAVDAEHPQTPAERFRSSLLRGLELTRLPPPEPLVAGFLNLDSIALIYGRPKGGKTFVGIDLALSIATGTWWHGQEVTAGTVLYVMAEGARGASLRLQAWLQHQRLHNDPERYVVLPVAPNLLDPGSVGGLVEVAVELQPVLIVIDTLNRCMPGTDEGPADMGKAIWALDALRLATGACVAPIHHSGKDSSKGARGHSSLLGAVDTELEVLNANDGIITLRTTAQRNMAEANPQRFTLAPVADSLVVADYTGRLSETDTVTSHGRICMDVLDRIATETGIATSVWRDAAGEDGVGRSSFYAQVKQLEQLGEIENVGTPRSQRWRPRT